MKSAGADAIFAVLIFLNLLERHAESFAEFRLAHFAPLAQKPNPRTDQHVNRIRPFGAHAVPLCSYRTIAVFAAAAIFGQSGRAQRRYLIALFTTNAFFAFAVLGEETVRFYAR